MTALDKNSLKFKCLKFEYLAFVSALGLMSRIPIGPFTGQNELSPEHHNRSQIWYPWVGALLGLFFLVWCLVAPDSWSSFLQAVVIVVIWVSFTGALHLDGLADSVDAWIGGMGPDSTQRTLSIMKDPTSGPMAVTALVLVLLFKVALVAEILDSTHGAGLALLSLTPVLARSWLLPLLYKTDYARLPKFDAQNVQTSERANQQHQQSGMAEDIASGFPFNAAAISFGICQLIVIFALLFSGWSLFIWIALNLVAAALFVLIRHACIQRIGGYTGDVLGAFIELQEVALLFVLALLLALVS